MEKGLRKKLGKWAKSLYMNVKNFLKHEFYENITLDIIYNI